MELSFKLGLRTGECMALKWSDFDFETEKLSLKRSITKGIISEQNEKSLSNKNHFRKIIPYHSTDRKPESDVFSL